MKRIQKLSDEVIIKNQPPEYMRGVLGFGYRVDGVSVVFYELCPESVKFNIKKYSDMIRADYNLHDNKWHIFFRSCYGDWDLYGPLSSVERFETFISEIELFIRNRSVLVAFNN